MHVRKTRTEELTLVMDIYAYARKFQAEHGNPNQWGPTNWPPQSLIEKDIEVGKSYVCVTDEDRVVGVFYFDVGKDIEPTYREITDGAWKDDSPYGVMHRLAGDGSVKGIGKCCLSWAAEQCPHLRVDTHGDNIVMQNIFEKNGFERMGTIYVEEDDYPRYAYEKC